MKTYTTPLPLQVDAYQANHFELIPPGMENFQCSQVIHRKNLYEEDRRLVSAGLSPFVHLHMTQRVTMEDIKKAEDIYSDFHAPGTPYRWPIDLFKRIVNEHDGYLPIVITGLKDGQAFYTGEPQVQIWTDVPGMGELVGWIESDLLPYLWSSTIVATRGRHIKERMIEVWRESFPEKSTEELEEMCQYTLHDFARRGAENSQITGLAHLLNWPGTDTMDAVWLGYALNDNKKFGACSIHAAAHRTVTPWIKEMMSFENMLDKNKGGIFAFVADSNEYFACVKHIAENYAKRIKDENGYLVVRPDSGDPVECIVKGLEILSKGFGFKTNAAGFKKLDNCGIIQGDGIDESILFDKIYPAMLKDKWCPSNLAVGMGQGNHRAERSMIETAYKTCLVGTKDGQYKPVMKFSNSPMKMSLPCPVGIDVNRRFGVRVCSVSINELKQHDLGSYHLYYDGRDPKNIIFNIPLFETNKRLALNTWKNLERNPGDTLCQQIRDMQIAYGKSVGINI